VAFHARSQNEEARIRDRSEVLVSNALGEALAELFDLLEQYAPSWYTEKHHEKAARALQMVKKSERRKAG